jgi:hypothetical protein
MCRFKGKHKEKDQLTQTSRWKNTCIRRRVAIQKQINLEKKNHLAIAL